MIENYSEFSNRLNALRAASLDGKVSLQLRDRIEAALNGQASEELRRLVKIDELRRHGAFFTDEGLAEKALENLIPSLEANSVVLDPACGAGNLLIPCASALPQWGGQSTENPARHHRVLGRDIHPEFVSAAQLRLSLAFSLLHGFSIEDKLNPDILSNCQVACGLSDLGAYEAATHVVLNPPFTMVDSPEKCKWGRGKVNAAAVFLDRCLDSVRPGTRIAAILPDVLRSGSRYKRWRGLIEARARIDRIEIYGQFAPDVDVDVFLLDLQSKPSDLSTLDSNGCSGVSWVPRIESQEVLSDHFEICIGPVVDYRDPHQGSEYAFVHSRDLVPWAEVATFLRRRRFRGRVCKPPFVAIRRTSRPGDQFRAVGTIITGKKEIAVENHLICIFPKGGGLKACRSALRQLKNPRTSRWLDNRIRCRHLTVSALAELPWWSAG